MDYELSIDPLVICRCCLAEHSALKTVFCNEIVNGSILPFPKVFECVTGFKVAKDDGFPDKLCPVCRQLINDSYILQQKCKTNRQLLIGILKIEVPTASDSAAERAKNVVQVSASTQTVQPDGGHCAATQTEHEPATVTASTAMQTDDDDAFNKATVVSIASSTQTERVSNAGQETQTEDLKLTSTCTQTTEITKPIHGVEVDEDSEMQDVDTTTTVHVIQTESQSEELETSKEIYEMYDTESGEYDNHGTTTEDDYQLEYLIEDNNVPHDPDAAEASISEKTLQPEQLPTDAVTGTENEDDDYSIQEEEAADEFIINHFIENQNRLSTSKCVRKRTAKAMGGPSASFASAKVARKADANKKTAQTLRKITRTVSSSTINNTTGQPQQFACALCSYNAKSDRDFGTHLHGHKRWLPILLDSIYYFRCGDCLAIFLTADDLEAHRQQMANADEADRCCRFGVADGEDGNNADGGRVPCTDYQFLDDEFAVDDEDGTSANRSSSVGVSSGELDLEDPQLLNIALRVCSGATVRGARRNRFACDRCDEFVCDTTADMWQHCNEHHFIGAALDEVVRISDDGNDDDDDDAKTTKSLDAASRFVESWSWAHKCGYCDQVFRSIRSAAAHVFFHAHRYQCPYIGCIESYTRYAMLGQHLDRVHHQAAIASAGGADRNTDWQMFECGYCEQSYEAYADYRLHLRTECKGRQFVCKQCDKRFFSKHHLEIHMKYHQNMRRFKCQYCDKRFTQSGDQRIHERIHTGEKPYQCPICPKTFRSIGNRKDHLATHDNQAKVTCKECGSQFKSDRILRGHMAIHATEKRFKCAVCPKEFYRKYHLTQHTLTHQATENIEADDSS